MLKSVTSGDSSLPAAVRSVLALLPELRLEARDEGPDTKNQELGTSEV